MIEISPWVRLPGSGQKGIAMKSIWERPPHPKEVYLVDDDVITRRLIHETLAGVGVRVWPFKSASDFLEYAINAEPAPIIIDFKMPEMNGVELLKALSRTDIRWPSLICTAHGNIPLAVEAMKLGAVEFLEKPVSKRKLLESLAASYERLGELLESQRYVERAREALARLTARESEIALHLSEGRTNKEIARKLQISPRTVEAHRATLLAKLDVTSIPAMMHLLFSAGIIKPL